MSFTSFPPATPRLQRSELAVPGSNPALFEKAAHSAADVIFLDVEDAVAPDDKEQARRNIIQALNDVNWSNKTMMVRINGLDTHYMYRDVVDIVEACPRLDMLLIPKVGVPQDVYALDMFYTVFKKDPMNATEGRRYRHTVLERGGSQPEMQTLEDFLGRKPQTEAFYEELGLS